jgi:hypothetical protein
MIGRIWHGWTTLENVDRYERLVKALKHLDARVPTMTACSVHKDSLGRVRSTLSTPQQVAGEG